MPLRSFSVILLSYGPFIKLKIYIVHIQILTSFSTLTSVFLLQDPVQDATLWCLVYPEFWIDISLFKSPRKGIWKEHFSLLFSYISSTSTSYVAPAIADICCVSYCFTANKPGKFSWLCYFSFFILSWLSGLLFNFYLFIWPHCIALSILVPWLGLNPCPLKWKRYSIIWTTREVLWEGFMRHSRYLSTIDPIKNGQNPFFLFCVLATS